MTNENHKLQFIDALRGIAIIGVVFHHTRDFVAAGNNNIFNFSIDKSSIGVQLFYIISAFTLFLSYRNRILNEKYHVLNFFIRRFFRIAPLYYLAVVFYLFWGETLITRMWLKADEHITIANIISNLFFIHQINPSWINSLVPGGWSIAVEMSFYLLVPLLFKYLKNLYKSILFFTVSFLIMIVCNKLTSAFPLSTDQHLEAAYVFFYLPSQLPVFLLGIIFYFFFIKKTSLSKINSTYVLAIFLMLGFILSKYIIPLHIVFSFLVLIMVILISTFKPKILTNSVFCKIGEFSFAIYLFHHAVFYVLKHFLTEFSFSENVVLNYMIWFLLCLFFTTILSYFLSIIIEKPMLKMGKNIIEKLESKKH